MVSSLFWRRRSRLYFDLLLAARTFRWARFRFFFARRFFHTDVHEVFLKCKSAIQPLWGQITQTIRVSSRKRMEKTRRQKPSNSEPK